MTDSFQTHLQVPAGPRKAAAALLAMGKPAATQVLKHFSPDELRQVTVAAARLGSVSMDELEKIVDQFTSDFSTGASLLGDESKARALFSDAVPPEQISEALLERPADRPRDVWQTIASLPDASLAAFLKEERPLTATYILSRLESGVAARVVAQLPRDLRNRVLCGLVSPPTIVPQARDLFETALGRSVAGASAGGQGEDRRVHIAEIINDLEAGEAGEAMRALRAARPQDARAVERMLFSFNDLARLSQRGRALLFDKIATETVVLALRGTEADFREPVLASMASRSRRLVENELANPSSAPPPEIAKARKQIVKAVLSMSQRGEIELPASDESARA
jgi:flagellar motor switch protein FliG